MFKEWSSNRIALANDSKMEPSVDDAIRVLKSELSKIDLASKVSRLSETPERHPLSKDFLTLKFLIQDLKTLEAFPPSEYRDQVIKEIHVVLDKGMSYAVYTTTLVNTLEELRSSLAEARDFVERISNELTEVKEQLSREQELSRSLKGDLDIAIAENTAMSEQWVDCRLVMPESLISYLRWYLKERLS